MTARSGYSSLQIALHWGVAALVLFNYVYSEGMGRALDGVIEGGGDPLATAGLHVWVGVAVLVLVTLRLLVRLNGGAPAPLGDPASLQARAAGLGHLALYLLMIAVPTGGILAWFAKVEEAGDLHEVAANILMILAGLHAAMALVHHFVLKDATLVRMIRRG